MNRGINEKMFRERFGIDIKSLYGKEIEKFIGLDLMRYDGESYSLTEKGIDVSNSILCEFV